MEKSWVRSTLEKPNLKARTLHRMKPILAGDLIILGNSIDGIAAWRRSSAEPVWKRSIEGGAEADAVLYDGALFFGAGDGFFYKIKAIDGSVLWSHPIQSEGLGVPTVRDGKVFFVAGNGVAHALDTETGKSVWRYKRSRSSYLSVRGGSKPLITESVGYFGFADGYLVALETEKGRLVWEKRINRNKKFKDIDAEPIISGDTLYVSSYDGSFVALDKSSGQLKWQTPFGGFSAPIISDSRVFISTSDDQVVALNKKSGEKIWSHKTRSLATQPKLHTGLIVAGEYSGSLKFLDSETGELIKEFFPGRGVHSEVSVDKETGKFYFMSADANLFALRVKWDRLVSQWPWEEKL